VNVKRRGRDVPAPPSPANTGLAWLGGQVRQIETLWFVTFADQGPPVRPADGRYGYMGCF